MFDEERLLNEFLSLYIAGIDTTGHLLAHAVYFLAANKSCYEELMTEITSKIKSLDDIKWEVINKEMPYLNATI